MKFKINSSHFASGLAQVVNVVGSRASNPILSNVLVEAEGDVVSLTTTNLDLAIRVRVKAEVSFGGRLTLPVKKLQAIIGTTDDCEVVAELVGPNRMKFTAGRAVFHIMGLDPATFPSLTTFNNQYNFVLKQSDLAELLKKVAYAQSTDENRYILNGVFFSFYDGRLAVVATDGRRLALDEKELPIGPDQNGSLILPAKTVAELQRVLKNDAEVKIAFNDRHVSFVVDTGANKDGLVDNVFIVSKIVEGNFPNFRQVIPKSSIYRIEVEREAFLKVLKRGSLMAMDKSSSVKLAIGENELEVTSTSSEIGEANDRMTIKFDGEPVSVAFNPQFLNEPLNALTDDEIVFEFSDSNSPGLIRDKKSFLCVIMPQRM